MALLPELPRVRAATDADGESMRAIYNEAVATTVATFDTEPRSREEQLRWLDEHRPPYVALVAESDGEVVGWASLSRWSERRAYAGTAEVSLYVATPRRGTGIGRLLLAQLVEAGERAGFHTLLARIADGNAVSLHLHAAFGFRSVGVMKEVGMKFGRRIDVHLLQRIFPDPGVPGSASSGSPPVRRGSGRSVVGRI